MPAFHLQHIHAFCTAKYGVHNSIVLIHCKHSSAPLRSLLISIYLEAKREMHNVSLLSLYKPPPHFPWDYPCQHHKGVLNDLLLKVS